MVEPTFLVVVGVAFVILLVLILRGAGSKAEELKSAKEKKPKVPKKLKGPKGPQRNSLPKERRPTDVREWTGVDTAAKDAQEMLEFLKGKDPAEIAKQNKQNNNSKKKPQQAQQPKPTKKGSKAVDTASEDSASDSVEEGFSLIKNKKVEKKSNQKPAAEIVEKKEDKKASKRPSNKPFFKESEAEIEERKQRKEKFAQERREGGQDSEQKERKPRVEGEEGVEKRERKERPPRERKERPEGEIRQRKPITVAPNVKYEQADLDDILNSITQDYKPKPKAHRISSVFSKIPRNIVVTILSKLQARDLVALSGVNHYFWGVARKDSLWKELAQRDFGLRDAGKYRTFAAAFRDLSRRQRNKKGREAKEAKEPKETKEKDVVASPTEEKEPKAKKEESKGKKEEPKGKKDKQKKVEEKPTEGAAEE